MDSDPSIDNSDDEDFVIEKEKSKKAIKTNDSTKKVVKKVTTKKKPEEPKSPKRKQPAKKKKEHTANEENEEKKEKNEEIKNVNPGKIAKKNNIRDEGANTVLEYMRKQNRPYSLINILDNLHGEIKKAQGLKILDQLSEEGELKMKEYGKARIYLINQKNIPEADKTEMDDLKNSLEKCKIEHSTLAAEIKGLKKKEIDLNNQLTNEELEKEIEKYEGLVTESELKIAFYQSDDYQKLPDSIIKEAENEKIKMEKEYKKRKRMCMDIISQLAENMDKKVKEVEELIGIEKD